MILRATFENILSFKDEVQISFVAGKSDLLPEHVNRANKRDDISILKSGIVYGANASGKSNIIKAISIIQDIALGRYPRRKTGHQPQGPMATNGWEQEFIVLLLAFSNETHYIHTSILLLPGNGAGWTFRYV